MKRKMSDFVFSQKAEQNDVDSKKPDTGRALRLKLIF